MSALKYNMRFFETSKLDLSILFQIEYWLKGAMYEYDKKGAELLEGFIEDGINGANEYIYHYMRFANAEYIIMGGGKKAFRELPKILRIAIFQTKEYKEYKSSLESDAKHHNCPVNELELNDDHVPYDSIKW